MKTKAFRRLSILLVAVMILSSLLMTTASAEYDDVQLTARVYFGDDGEGSVNYLGTETEEIPDDLFAIAIEYDSGATGVGASEFRISWDPTKIEFFLSSYKDGDLLEVYTGRHVSAQISGENILNVAAGKYNSTQVSTTNWTYRSGMTNRTLTQASLAFIYFRPLTSDATNATITFEMANMLTALPGGASAPLTVETTNLTIPLNGGAVDVDPVVSLGAKVNAALRGLRFGAQFNKKELMGEIDEIGMLLYPTAKLGGDTLDMDYYLANPYSAANETGVLKIRAVGIAAADFVPGRAFGLYDRFTYFVTLLDVPVEQSDTNVTAVPFIKYADGTIVYGATLVRNYNAVLAAADPIEE